MKKELLTEALGTLAPDIIGDCLTTEKKLKKKRAARFCSALAACLAIIIAIPIGITAFRSASSGKRDYNSVVWGVPANVEPEISDFSSSEWNGVMISWKLSTAIEQNPGSVFCFVLSAIGSEAHDDECYRGLTKKSIDCVIAKGTLYIFSTADELIKAFRELGISSEHRLTLAEKKQFESDAGLLDHIPAIKYTASDLEGVDSGMITVWNHYPHMSDVCYGKDRNTVHLAYALSSLLTEVKRRDELISITVWATDHGILNAIASEYDSIWTAEYVSKYIINGHFSCRPEDLTPSLLEKLSHTPGVKNIDISASMQIDNPE